MSTIPSDILLQSRQAKSYFFDRCTLLGLDPFVVAEYAGVNKDAFTDWVNALDDEGLLKTVTQQQAMIIYESVGVFPRLSFIVVPVDELEPNQKRLINELKIKK